MSKTFSQLVDGSPVQAADLFAIERADGKSYRVPFSALGNAGIIQGCGLTYNATDTLGANAGMLDINGNQYVNAGAIMLVLAGMTPLALHYVYASANGAAWKLEVSTTVPIFDTALNAWKKTGDATRRCIGSVYAITDTTMMPFTQSGSGRLRFHQYFVTDFTNTTIVNYVVGTGVANWLAANFASIVPVTRTLIRLLVNLINNNAARKEIQAGITGLNPVPGSTLLTNCIAPVTVSENLDSGSQVYLPGEIVPTPGSSNIYWVANCNGGLASDAVLGLYVVGFDFEI